MATDIIPFNSGSDLPAHLADLFEGGNIAPRITINQLSYRGKVWRRIVDGEEVQITRKNEDGDTEPVPIVSVVVLDQNKKRSRAFYKGAYEEGKNAAPDCFSADGVTPDAGVKEPCSATCATCPNAEKGSKITENGKQATACTAFKRIAIVPSGAQIGKHPIMLLRLAQTSIWDKDNGENEAKGWYAWDQYLDMLRARGARHTAAVETKVKFDLRQAYPKLLFSAARWLNPDEAVAAKARIEAEPEVITKILDGGGADGVAGTSVAAGNDDVDDPAVDAEAVRKAAAATAVAQAKAAADADKKAKAAAAAQAKKEAEELAAAEAATKAPAADVDAWGDDEPAAPAPAKAAAKPKPAAKAPTPEVVGTPAGLEDLLSDWDA